MWLISTITACRPDELKRMSNMAFRGFFADAWADRGTTGSSKNGTITLSRMNFSGCAGHVTIFS